ncbi:hypothetical protein [Undibacterium terreum]|uniref:Uncharacterized protein n=1 Tax=Undibacterium terreum TaxID=1224302 RepID=A0A916XLC1_9BURK|nr:hypothetical protein [Undibacterium terreum]GGC83420.1 hypothetical protein GCM10011396_33540 [Undibacterium terreum]
MHKDKIRSKAQIVSLEAAWERSKFIAIAHEDEDWRQTVASFALEGIVSPMTMRNERDACCPVTACWSKHWNRYELPIGIGRLAAFFFVIQPIKKPVGRIFPTGFF